MGNLDREWSPAETFHFLSSLDRVPLDKPKLVPPSNNLLDKFKQPDGLVVWFRFIEGVGTTLRDFSGYGNHGTIYGARWTRYGGLTVLSFDGVDDYVTLPSMLHDDFTIMMLVYPFKDAHAEGEDYGLYNCEGTKGYVRIWQSDGYGNKFAMWVYDGSTVASAYTSSPATPNKWHTIAFQREGSKFRAFYNGVLERESEFTLEYGLGGPNHKIGWYGGKPPYYFPGLIALVCIYDQALNPEEIRALCKGLI